MNERCQSVRRVHTVHATPCLREEGHAGPCGFADGNGLHLWLDGYEITNLRSVLDAVHDLGGKAPTSVFMNGDWFEQVRTKLNIYLPHNNPNALPNELVEQFERRSGTKE